MPKISVLIPVYNGETYLADCVHSVCQQTYRDLEILIVNDGSTDRTAAICESLKAEDDRIRVHHKGTNEGIGAGRNTAISLATGEFVVFIDSDDWMDPNHIEDLYDLLTRTGSDVAVANFTQYYQDRNAYNLHISAGDYYEETYSPEEWFRFQYGHPHNLSLCFTVPWCKLYRKSLFENVLYPIDKHADDDFTTWKLYLLADKIAYMHRSSYVYRVNETSLTQVGKQTEIFSIEPIEERLALLSLIGLDISRELAAYDWRAHVNRDEYLKAGEIAKHKNLQLRLQLMAKYNRK